MDGVDGGRGVGRGVDAAEVGVGFGEGTDASTLAAVLIFFRGKPRGICELDRDVLGSAWMYTSLERSKGSERGGGEKREERARKGRKTHDVRRSITNDPESL